MDSKIYHKFFAKDRNSENLIEYQIKKLPENLFENALELYERDFLPDETMCSTKGIHENENSLKEILSFWRHTMEEHLSLACFKSNNNELVAINVMCIKSKNKDENSFKV